MLDQELVTDVSVINETRQDPGGFYVMAELRDGADPQKVEKSIRAEIEAVASEGVAKKDLARIRTQIEASFLFQDEAVLDLAMKLARFEAGTPDGYRTLANVLPTYASLTTKELAATAARYLDFRRAAVVWAMPAAGAAPAPAKGKSRPKAGAKAKQLAKAATKRPAKATRGAGKRRGGKR